VPAGIILLISAAEIHVQPLERVVGIVGHLATGQAPVTGLVGGAGLVHTTVPHGKRGQLSAFRISLDSNLQVVD